MAVESQTKGSGQAGWGHRKGTGAVPGTGVLVGGPVGSCPTSSALWNRSGAQQVESDRGACAVGEQPG